MECRRIDLNPENASLQALKETARVGTGETALRCTAIQLLIMGIDREQICGALMVSLRSLQKWVKAFNEQGIDGLLPRKGRGRPRRISSEQAKQLVDSIKHPERVGKSAWTVRAFHGFLTASYRIDCSYSTVVRLFHKNGFALKVPQPWPNRQNEAQRKAFRKRLKRLCQDKKVELWFADESGFEGESRPRRRWDQKGNKTRVIHNGDHIRINVLGMVAPRTGEFFAIEASRVVSDVFQAFLDEAARFVPPHRKHNILILDNASGHSRLANPDGQSNSKRRPCKRSASGVATGSTYYGEHEILYVAAYCT